MKQLNYLTFNIIMKSTNCVASLILTPRQLTKQTIFDIQVSTFVYDIEFSVTINHT